MKNIICLIMTAAFVFWAPNAIAETGGKGYYKSKIKAHRSKQQAENKAFRKTLKDKPQEERVTASLNHREKQHTENVAFSESLHNERMQKLESRLSGKDRITPEAKEEILAFNEQLYQDSKQHRAQQHSENMDFISNYGASAQSKEEWKSLFQSHRNKQKSENKAFRESQKMKRKEYHASFKKDK